MTVLKRMHLFALSLALAVQASGGPVTISLHGGPSTNDVCYRINGAAIPYQQVEDALSSLSRLDRLTSINIGADETVSFGSVVSILRRLRELGLGNYVLIAGGPKALTVVIGDEDDLNDLTRKHYDRLRPDAPVARPVAQSTGDVTNQPQRGVGSNATPSAVRTRGAGP